MRLTRLWFAAELRRGWRQQVTLALLVGFVGAAVLTCAAAARRTESTYRRYVAAQGGADLEAYSGARGADVPAVVRSLAAVPGVRAVGAYDTLFAAPDRDDVLPGQDFLLLAPADDRWSRTVERPIVVDGRLPRPEAPDEVMVNERAAEALNIRVGTRTRLRSLHPDEADALQSGDFDAIRFAGSKPNVRVVGIARARFDLQAVSYARQYFITSRAFYDKNIDTMFGFGGLMDLRLEPGADVDDVASAVSRRLPSGSEGSDISRLADGARGLRDSARAQAIALLLVALAALAAGVVAVSQAIARSVNATGPDLTTLATLGVDRRERVRLTSASFFPAAVTGAGVAVGIAWIASRWFPTGVARQAEVATGAQFDARVLLIGAALIIVAVVARAAFGAWRQTVAAGARSVSRSVWLDRVTAALTPATATGVRWAVRRHDGSQAPSRAGLVAPTVAVLGLLAVLSYTSGLDHVVSTPAAYGWSFDAYASGGGDHDAVARLRDALLKQRSIGDVAMVTVIGGVVGVDGTRLQAWAFDDVRGHIGPTVVTGRPPRRDDEVLLGTKSASDLDVEVGDVVRATGAPGRRTDLRVVGTGLFSTLESEDFTSGMVTTRARLRTLAGRGYDEFGGHEDIVFRWTRGTDPQAAEAQLRAESILVTLAAPPPGVANLRAVRNYPRWLAAFLVVLGLLAAAHALVVSTRRRRREMGVLRAIGFSRRQVSRAVSTQGVTVGIVAVLVGVPVGLAIGRWVWVSHAARIGIGTTLTVSVMAVLLVAVCTVALIWLIATAAGHRASRARLTTALRVE